MRASSRFHFVFCLTSALAFGCAETTPANNDCPSNVQNADPSTGSNGGNNSGSNNGNNSGSNNGNNSGNNNNHGGNTGHDAGSSNGSDAGGTNNDVDGGTSTGDGDGNTSNGHNPVEGTGKDCSSTKDTRDMGGCYGFFCGTNEGDLRAEVSSGAVCGSDKEVAATCDGQPARVVAKCARDNALSFDPTSATRDCARKDSTLADITDPCLECYVQSAKCARDNCLTQCLAGDSAGCDKCREDNHCTPDFYGCAGLPNPQ